MLPYSFAATIGIPAISGVRSPSQFLVFFLRKISPLDRNDALQWLECKKFREIVVSLFGSSNNIVKKSVVREQKRDRDRERGRERELNRDFLSESGVEECWGL